MCCVCQMDEKLSLLEQKQKLAEQVEELTKQRKDRLQKLAELKCREKQLCDVLSERPCAVHDGIVPSLKQFAELEEHVLRLECKKVGVQC